LDLQRFDDRARHAIQVVRDARFKLSNGRAHIADTSSIIPERGLKTNRSTQPRIRIFFCCNADKLWHTRQSRPAEGETYDDRNSSAAQTMGRTAPYPRGDQNRS